MTKNNGARQLLLVGAGPRLMIAMGIIAALWAAFFWAIATPGGL